MKRKVLHICLIILICYLAGCSKGSESESEWIEEYSSLITEFKFGKEVLLPVKEPNGLAYDGRFIWVADYQTGNPGEIISIDISTGKQHSSFAVFTHMEGLTWDGKNIWVGAPRNKITKLDAESLEIVESIDSPTGEDADGLAWDGQYLWVSSHFHGKKGAEIIKVDVDSWKKLQVISLPFKEVGDIAYMDGYIWAVRFALTDDPEDKPFVVKIDTESGKIVKLYYNQRLTKIIWGLTHAEGRLWLTMEIDQYAPPKIMEVIID